MKALKNEHNGSQETNRVQCSRVNRRWVIRPPLNYKHDSSLPPNKAIIGCRDKARLEYQARVLSQIIQKARDDKIAEQLIKKSLNEARFLALGNTDIAWRARYQNEHQQQGHQFQPNAVREGTRQRAN